MKLHKSIGLAEGIAIVVGGVIGMGVYVLVPSIVQKAGEAYWLALIIALTVSVISVLPLIQISSALPVAGGGYIYASRFISPLVGILTSCWGLIGGACSVSLISVGLADYFQGYLPFHCSPHLMAMLLVASFYIFYLFGIKLLSGIQIILSIQLLVALLLYALPVLVITYPHIHLGTSTGSGFAMAVILTMNIALGFQIIIELGEEMREPQKNIPLSLLFGVAAIFLIYLLVMLAYDSTGVQPPVSLVESGKGYFPSSATWFIEFGMVSAGLTSYNGAAITLPREIFAMSRDLTLPVFFSKVNRKGNPIAAVTVFFLLVLVILGIGQMTESLGFITLYFDSSPLDFYGYMTIMGIMLLTIPLCISAFRLPKRYPAALQKAYIRFPICLLNTFIIISIISSLLMIGIICSKWIVPAFYLFFSLIILVYYLLRKRQLKSVGLVIGRIYEGFREY